MCRSCPKPSDFWRRELTKIKIHTHTSYSLYHKLLTLTPPFKHNYLQKLCYWQRKADHDWSNRVNLSNEHICVISATNHCQRQKPLTTSQVINGLSKLWFDQILGQRICSQTLSSMNYGGQADFHPNSCDRVVFTHMLGTPMSNRTKFWSKELDSYLRKYKKPAHPTNSHYGAWTDKSRYTRSAACKKLLYYIPDGIG